MKLKVTPLYLLSLLLLVFLVHEVHDWAHTLMARISCSCWGPRFFDGWDFCTDCIVSSGHHAITLIDGILINYLLLWMGWGLQDEDNLPEEQSLGCSLVFATLPLNMLLAAASGGGDLTNAIRFLQRHGPRTNHLLVSISGLVLTLLLVLPPLLRTFLRLPAYKGKFILFPILLVALPWLDKVVNALLNKWLIPSGTPQQLAYSWVLTWLLLLLIGSFLTRRRLQGLFNELSI